MPDTAGSLFDGLVDGLEATLRSGSSEQRAAMLRAVSDLLLGETDRLNVQQIGVLDDVLVALIERIEARTLLEVSQRLAPVAKAQIDLALNLARHTGARISEAGLAALLRDREVSVRST